MAQLVDLDVVIALFAFTPVPGSRMEVNKPPAKSHYRRIQTALYLLREKKINNFSYNDNDQIVDFGVSNEELRDILRESNVFETSGCSDCKRTYYNAGTRDKQLYNNPCKVSDQSFNAMFKNIFDYE